MKCQFLSCRQENVSEKDKSRLIRMCTRRSFPVDMPGNAHEAGVQCDQGQAEHEADDEKARTLASGHRSNIAESKTVPAYKQNCQCQGSQARNRTNDQLPALTAPRKR